MQITFDLWILLDVDSFNLKKTSENCKTGTIFFRDKNPSCLHLKNYFTSFLCTTLQIVEVVIMISTQARCSCCSVAVHSINDYPIQLPTCGYIPFMFCYLTFLSFISSLVEKQKIRLNSSAMAMFHLCLCLIILAHLLCSGSKRR